MQGGKEDVGGERRERWGFKEGNGSPPPAPAPAPAYITIGALGLDPIVYIQCLFSRLQWMTTFPSTNQIKNSDQISLAPYFNIIFAPKKKTHRATIS